jgi:C-terminal processing protease CtpA/Prc
MMQACASACEFFAYDLTLESRSAILGHYTTAGAGGSVEDFLMPEDISVRFTTGRAVDAEGNIHIEGTGVPPTIRVPFDEEAFQAEFASAGDLLLEDAQAEVQ